MIRAMAKSKLLLIYLAILALLILAACNPILKAERRVLNDVASSERVFRELEKTRPCANDTSFVTLLDTLVTTDTITDYKTDTIDNVITKTLQGKTIYKTKRVVEIKTGYIVDTRRLGIVLDSVRFYKQSFESSKDAHKKLRFKFWALIGLLMAFFILKRFVWSYLNILH
jgi:hypothetical protein